MVDKSDALIPDTSTIWQLWYSDTFDRDAPRSLQSTGQDILQGLYALWRYTIREGIMDNGAASFSYFHLTWGNSAVARVDIAVNPFHNPALLKLRRWTGFMAQNQKNDDERIGIHNDEKCDAILVKLAQMHYDLLRKSSRFTASAIAWEAEAQDVLARVDSISDPEDL